MGPGLYGLQWCRGRLLLTMGATMRKGKLVHLETHHPIALSGEVEVPWADVWARTSTSKRRWLRIAPTIVGTVDLKYDLKRIRRLQGEHPGLFDERVEHLERALEATSRGDFYFEEDAEGGMPALYVPHGSVNRASAEEAIGRYLAAFHGHPECRFRWRRPKLMTMPATVPC